MYIHVMYVHTYVCKYMYACMSVALCVFPYAHMC